jgi:DNA-binding NarL/FixJ family response regulator
LEARVLAMLSEAIMALAKEKYDTTADCVKAVIEGGAYDPLVIAVRALPNLGAFIAEQPQWRSWLQRLLDASRDSSLATSLGLQISRGARARANLSPRETEVHELLAQGLTNEEIANLLYISLSTTKVHVKHIYEKLGVRSRLEAARALRSDV